MSAHASTVVAPATTELPSTSAAAPEAAPSPTIAGLSFTTALILLVALLTTVGLIAIYAASSLKGAQQFGDEYLFLRKQAVSAVLGFGMIFAMQRLPLSIVQRATLPFLGFVVFLLALIFVPGMYVKVGGAARWLRLPLIGGQPSELAKLALVLFLARNLSRPKSNVAKFTQGILPNVAVLGVLTGFLLIQKDLGTPVLMTIVTGAMLFAAGVTRRFVVTAFGASAGIVAVAVAVEPYRLARILTFLDPWGSVRNGGFQIIQSFVAFQNGGLFGVGLGESKQKLFFLPEAHTDFILSVIGEELGLCGVGLIIAALLALCVIGYKISELQTSSYRRFLAFGLTTIIAVQASLNMGVAMGLLPTKGMPLPFISSGNSSLLVFLAVSAILARLGKDLDREAPRHERSQGS